MQIKKNDRVVVSMDTLRLLPNKGKLAKLLLYKVDADKEERAETFLLLTCGDEHGDMKSGHKFIGLGWLLSPIQPRTKPAGTVTEQPRAASTTKNRSYSDNQQQFALVMNREMLKKAMHLLAKLKQYKAGRCQKEELDENERAEKRNGGSVCVKWNTGEWS